jgi:predicted alpha/beta-fold hydrolase
LHDDRPPDWRASDRSVLLIHGLAGSHESGYMQRISRHLNARGIRAFRLDLRNCGAGVGLAKLPYHSGRSEDAAAALEAIARLAPDSPATLVGFSLGANITLKLLGELAGRPCGQLDSAVAVCPPTDLAACSRRISLSTNRLYDRYFVSRLLRQLRSARFTQGAVPRRVPRTLWEFDDTFTAVVCGFGTAEDYYSAASSAPLISRIAIPTLILASRDDPMIPSSTLEEMAMPPAVELRLTDHGGHLGFVGRRGVDADRRWMDWRVVDWVACRAPAGVLHARHVPGPGNARSAQPGG